MASDYIGRYGEALKRLTALEQGTFSPVNVGAPPAQAGAAPAFPMNAQQGAFDFQPAKPAIEQAEGAPMSASQLWADMPDEQKKDLEKQISHLDVDQMYDRQVTSGALVPKKKNPTRHDKIGYLAEVALRTISNMGRPGDQGINAWADAVLETDSRRGAMDQAEIAREREASEKARLEHREDTKDARRNSREDARRKEDNTRADAKEARDRAAAAADAEMRAEESRKEREAADARAKTMSGPKNKQIIYDNEGYAFDAADGSPIMVTKEVEKRGRRGRPGYKAKEQVHLRGTPKFAGGSTMDPDRAVYEIGKRAEALRKDMKARNAIRQQAEANGTDFETELQRVAEEQVRAQYASFGGGYGRPSGTPGASGLSPEDQAMLEHYTNPGGR